MPDDHSKSVPPLPIPNRTVKRLRANDSAATSVKVGHRQAFIQKTPQQIPVEGFLFWDFKIHSSCRSSPLNFTAFMHARISNSLSNPRKQSLKYQN